MNKINKKDTLKDKVRACVHCSKKEKKKYIIYIMIICTTKCSINAK